MQTVIHDLKEDVITEITSGHEDIVTIGPDKRDTECVGCFRCWLKQSGACVMKDRLRHVGALLGNSDTLTIISRCTYGGYSSSVKAVLDRSIGISLPFFTCRDGETHHIGRYPEKSLLRVMFYGSYTDLERRTAEELVERNRINLGYRNSDVLFFQNVSHIREAGI